MKTDADGKELRLRQGHVSQGYLIPPQACPRSVTRMASVAAEDRSGIRSTSRSSTMIATRIGVGSANDEPERRFAGLRRFRRAALAGCRRSRQEPGPRERERDANRRPVRPAQAAKPRHRATWTRLGHAISERRSAVPPTRTHRP